MNSYVAAGYGLTIGAIALYALRILFRGRSLARRLDGDGR